MFLLARTGGHLTTVTLGRRGSRPGYSHIGYYWPAVGCCEHELSAPQRT
ncbi:hypothetical protein HMPREF0742_02399 [Rothia aeria F0184]|uniref:Uncharacterized protein n=1 Tax=Rothia aeria F0184 TaxID=888019 RepID=U7UXH4_9MICC|nr:hypothetical protein HMPREF0742_02399 [Rothia aeria F0184]